jgi:hypothetical protein
MAAENTFVRPAILKFDGYYDHGSMLMKNFLRSKRVMEFWLRMAFLSQQNPCPCPCQWHFYHSRIPVPVLVINVLDPH